MYYVVVFYRDITRVWIIAANITPAVTENGSGSKEDAVRPGDVK